MIKYQLTKEDIIIDSGALNETIPAYAAVKILVNNPDLRKLFTVKTEENMTNGLQLSANIKYKHIDENFSEVWTLHVWSDKRKRVIQRTI